MTRKNWRKQPRVWTADKLDRLDSLLGQGKTDTAIARIMKTTPVAIKIARQRRLGHRRSTDTTWRTARQVAELFGLGCSKTVSRWIGMGLLPAQRGPKCGQNTKHLIHEDAVLAFIENPATWPAWAPDRITDEGLREWATELRQDVTFLTPGEVGERFSVAASTVNSWIHRGHVPATRYGNWWVRESDLAGFVPPYEFSKAGKSVLRFAAAEDTDILERRARGETLLTIAQAHGRSIGSIAGRLARLSERAA